jgi:hypothetical protein
MLDAIRTSEFKPEKKFKKSITDNEAYQQAKKRNSERRKEAYRKMKAKKKNGN